MSDTILPPRRFARTVLIVDAFKEDREYRAQRLRISLPNYVVLEADSGATGLAICQTQGVDCVILEMNLPDVPGFGLLIKLVPRASYPSCELPRDSCNHAVPCRTRTHGPTRQRQWGTSVLN